MTDGNQRASPEKDAGYSILKLNYVTNLHFFPMAQQTLVGQRLRYLTKHNIHKRHPYMSPVGFVPAIPASQRPQNHVLGRAATGTEFTRACPVTTQVKKYRQGTQSYLTLHFLVILHV
jgi:hypothetical protein